MLFFYEKKYKEENNIDKAKHDHKRQLKIHR